MNQLQFIENQTKASPKSISATLKLLAEDCTSPFLVEPPMSSSHVNQMSIKDTINRRAKKDNQRTWFN